jgi:hypothetical protein
MPYIIRHEHKKSAAACGGAMGRRSRRWPILLVQNHSASLHLRGGREVVGQRGKVVYSAVTGGMATIGGVCRCQAMKSIMMRCAPTSSIRMLDLSLLAAWLDPAPAGSIRRAIPPPLSPSPSAAPRHNDCVPIIRNNVRLPHGSSSSRVCQWCVPRPSALSEFDHHHDRHDQRSVGSTMAPGPV